jgi:hypothetical protein
MNLFHDSLSSDNDDNFLNILDKKLHEYSIHIEEKIRQFYLEIQDIRLLRQINHEKIVVLEKRIEVLENISNVDAVRIKKLEDLDLEKYVKSLREDTHKLEQMIDDFDLKTKIEKCEYCGK